MQAQHVTSRKGYNKRPEQIPKHEAIFGCYWNACPLHTTLKLVHFTAPCQYQQVMFQHVNLLKWQCLGSGLKRHNPQHLNLEIKIKLISKTRSGLLYKWMVNVVSQKPNEVHVLVAVGLTKLLQHEITAWYWFILRRVVWIAATLQHDKLQLSILLSITNKRAACWDSREKSVKLQNLCLLTSSPAGIVGCSRSLHSQSRLQNICPFHCWWPCGA